MAPARSRYRSHRKPRVGCQLCQWNGGQAGVAAKDSIMRSCSIRRVPRRGGTESLFLVREGGRSHARSGTILHSITPQSPPGGCGDDGIKTFAGRLNPGILDEARKSFSPGPRPNSFLSARWRPGSSERRPVPSREGSRNGLKKSPPARPSI